MSDEPLTIAEPPCIGLDPDTDPCPHCGAQASDPCSSKYAWRIDPADATHIEKWDGAAWVSDCWLRTPEDATRRLETNIAEAGRAKSV